MIPINVTVNNTEQTDVWKPVEFMPPSFETIVVCVCVCA